MGFNYRQKRKEFEQNWAKALKQYIAAGMTQEQITAMRQFDEKLFRQERVYENRVNVGLPDLNILRFSVEEDYFQDLSNHLDAAMENLCPGSSQKVTDQDRKVVLLACTGLKQEEIAVILHISQMSVYHQFRRCGLHRRERPALRRLYRPRICHQRIHVADVHGGNLRHH